MELDIHLVSYLVLGVFFFVVIWSVVQRVVQDMFPQKGVGVIIGIVIAAYGFWYPFIPVMSMLYSIIVAVIAVMGVGFSRIALVARWSTRGGWVTGGVAVGLIIFEIIQYILTSVHDYRIVIISWGLFVYGIIGIQKQSIEPVITSMGLPRVNLVQAAFVLACIVFLPLEFPVIYTLLSVAAVSGVVLGWYLTNN